MSEDIAVLKESRNRIAIQHGLPQIGSVMVNQYGIEWLVDGHLFLPTLATIKRQGVNPLCLEDPQDLYPVIIPQNLSPQLAAFIAETDCCTSKQIMPLDTCPHLRPCQDHPYGFSADGLSSPLRIVLFLDAVHIHEAILAHEIGHIWIDLVDDCEDYRMPKDLSDTGKVFHWNSLQSFVLDRKVNEVLREKGFDLSIIEQHTRAMLIQLTLALRSGYRPPNPREAAFDASSLAAAMLDNEIETGKSAPSVGRAAQAFERYLPEVYDLACRMADSVRRHGYSNRASIRSAIDECAVLAFQFTGEPFDLEADLVDEPPTECMLDKYPQYFPGLPVAAKLEIAKAMARMQIKPGVDCRLSYSPGGSVQVEFSQENGIWTAPILLKSANRLPDDFAFRGLHSPMLKGNPAMNKSTVTQPSRNPISFDLPPTTAPPRPAIVQPGKPSLPRFNGTPMRRSYSPGLGLFISRVRLEEQLLGESSYGYAKNNPVNYIDPDGNAPQRSGSTLGIPAPLKGCLNSQNQANLLKKLNPNTACGKAVKSVCKQNGLSAINNPKYIPPGGWIFPKPTPNNPRGLCHPDDPWGSGYCRAGFDIPRNAPPDYLPPSGTPCQPAGICISHFVCASNNPNLGACVAIWELVNACACANTGFDPGELNTAKVAGICGCGGLLGKGGVVIHRGNSK